MTMIVFSHSNPTSSEPFNSHNNSLKFKLKQTLFILFVFISLIIFVKTFFLYVDMYIYL